MIPTAKVHTKKSVIHPQPFLPFAELSAAGGRIAGGTFGSWVGSESEGGGVEADKFSLIACPHFIQKRACGGMGWSQCLQFIYYRCCLMISSSDVNLPNSTTASSYSFVG